MFYPVTAGSVLVGVKAHAALALIVFYQIPTLDLSPLLYTLYTHSYVCPYVLSFFFKFLL